MFVTDRLLLSEITAQHWPPAATPNSYSHHKISFFPSLSLSPTNTQSFSLCSLSCLLFVSLLHTGTFFPFLSLSRSCSCDPLALPLRHSQLFCQGARRRPDRDVRKHILPGAPSTEPQSPFHDSGSSARTQSSDGWGALAASAVQSGHSWCPERGQNQQDHHRGLITAKTHLVCQQYSRDRPKLDPTNPDAAK